MSDTINNTAPDNISSKKPHWIKVRAKQTKEYFETLETVQSLKLNTICAEGMCPNITECWSKKHAAFMILGSTCTRACKFCNVKTGVPDTVNLEEPINIAKAVCAMKLSHVVVTSVDRDDLKDGGATQFAQCIKYIRNSSPKTSIEVLTPDFLRKEGALEIVVKEKPDVYNHNIETVPSLYQKIRPGARYYHSLNLLHQVKKLDPSIFTKSGIMLGLGETEEEILQVMDDLLSAQVDFLTICQYLKPTPKHAEVKKYITPEKFDYFGRVAKSKGFKMVSSSAFTRSSYHADEDFVKLKNARQQEIEQAKKISTLSI